MLDKIIVVGNEAHFIFTDKRPFVLRSDISIVTFLMWFLNHPQARLIIKNDVVTTIELVNYKDDITMKIELSDVA